MIPANTNSKPTSQTGNTGGSTGATNMGNTTSSPKQVEVPPLQGGHGCPYGSYSVGSSGNACQPGTGSIICISTPGATTSTQTEFHVDAYGDLSHTQIQMEVVRKGPHIMGHATIMSLTALIRSAGT